MARSDGDMAQGSSKQPMGAKAPARRTPSGRVIAAKPAVGIRGGRAGRGLRPVSPPKEPADAGGAPGARSYRQWAAFVPGSQAEDGWFGAYFIGDLPSRYTWTPGRD
jgi:hypothetical protein